MPFQSPEMLERDFARGQVKEDRVDSPGVAVHTEVLHLMTKAGPLPVFGRRRDAVAVKPDGLPSRDSMGVLTRTNKPIRLYMGSATGTPPP